MMMKNLKGIDIDAMDDGNGTSSHISTDSHTDTNTSNLPYHLILTRLSYQIISC